MSESLSYETYQPTPKQLEAHLSPTKYKLYGGSMGGGKSVWICAEAIRLSLLWPGNVGLISRFTMRDFKRTTLQILLEMLPQKIIESYNKTDGVFKLKNGSTIICGDLEKPDKHKSLNLGFFAIDEATECPENVFNMLQTRLRRNIQGIRYFGLLATNPEPGWVKDRFITNRKEGYAFFQALPRENPHLPKNYIDDLERDLNPIWRAKYLDGSWEIFDSQIIRPDWIVPSSPMPNEFAFKVTCVDPAISENEDADETAIVTMGVEYNTNVIHEIEMVHGRWSFNEVIANIKAAKNRHNPNLLGVEMVAYQKAIGDVLNRDGITVTTLKADTDKVRRMLAISHLFERGKVRINNRDSQRQLIEFPNGTHDDLADAICHALTLVKQYTTEFKKEDDKYAHLDPRSKGIIQWEKGDHPLQKQGKTSPVADFYSKYF